MLRLKRPGGRSWSLSDYGRALCFCYTALHTFGDGCEVYGLMDAAGDSTPDAHKYGIQRMLQAGVLTITVGSLVSEWMHD